MFVNINSRMSEIISPTLNLFIPIWHPRIWIFLICITPLPFSYQKSSESSLNFYNLLNVLLRLWKFHHYFIFWSHFLYIWLLTEILCVLIFILIITAAHGWASCIYHLVSHLIQKENIIYSKNWYNSKFYLN